MGRGPDKPYVTLLQSQETKNVLVTPPRDLDVMPLCDWFNQQVIFSSYKNCNTAKALIGISPTGAVSFISELYGGNISDKEITKRSGTLDLMERGNEIMADQRFLIEDLVRPHGNSGVARVDQLPGHQVALYKLNMKICRHDI